MARKARKVDAGNTGADSPLSAAAGSPVERKSSPRTPPPPIIVPASEDASKIESALSVSKVEAKSDDDDDDDEVDAIVL